MVFFALSVWSWASLCIPAILSRQGDQVPLLPVDNELLILGSFYGAFPHHFQVCVFRKKYRTTQLARIVGMIQLVLRLVEMERNTSTGHGKHLVAVLREFDVTTKSTVMNGRNKGIEPGRIM